MRGGSGCIPQGQSCKKAKDEQQDSVLGPTPARTISCLCSGALFQIQQPGIISSPSLCTERSQSCEQHVTRGASSTGCYHINASSSLHKLLVQKFPWQQYNPNLASKQSLFLKLLSVAVRKEWLPFGVLIYARCEDEKG